MKKTLCFLTLFALFFCANAQQYLLQESFEEEGIPTGWTVIDNDEDGHNWFVLHNSASTTYNNHSGIGHITSASYSSGALTPDNWLITPAIPLTSNSVLTFWVAGQDQAWAAEHYSVYISTTGNSISDFTTALINDAVATGTMTQHTVYLSNYTGDTVYIAFRHHNITDMFRINLDDIEVSIAPTDPTIDITPNSLSFDAFVGSNTVLTTTVSAINLTSNITVSTTAPFAVSSDSINFASTTQLGLNGGNLYIQYTPTSVGLDSGSLTISSTGITDISIPLNGCAVQLGTLPYSQTFENEDENNNWLFYHNGENKWHIGTAENATSNGQYALYISNDNGTTNSYNNNSESTSWAYRDIDFGNNTEYNLSFKFKGIGEDDSYDYLKIYLGPPAQVQNHANSNGATLQGATLLGSFHNMSSWTSYSFSLPSSFSGIQRLYLLWWNDNNDGNNPPAAIDDLVITGSNCGRPGTPSVQNVSLNSAEISFSPSSATDDSWEYALCTNDESPYEVNAIFISDSSFTISNLESSTFYNVYVRTICANDEVSNWSNVLNFHTNCTTISSLPYEENFDNYTGSTSYTTNILPICWTSINTGSSNQGLPTIYNTPSYAQSGNNCLLFNTYNSTSYADQYAILNEIDTGSLPINTLMLSFAARTYTTYPVILEVGVMSDPLDVSTFQLVETVIITEESYTTKEVYFDNFTGSGNFVAFRAKKPIANYNSGYIDDIILGEMPDCSPVHNLSLSHIAGTSALVSWESGYAGDVSSYSLEISESGEDDWLSVSNNITGTSYLLSNLEPVTNYSIRVMTNCSDNNSSSWSEESFTTKCLAGGDITIAHGTGSSVYIPSYSYYKYGYSQQLFTSSELGGVNDLTSVSIDLAQLSHQRSFEIYLMHTTATSIPNTWLPTNDALLVFSGSQTLVEGWNLFEFDTIFTYNGSDNLLLIIIDGTGSYINGNTWRTHDAFSGSTCYIYNDNSSYNINNTPASGNSSSSRNNIIFGGICDENISCIAPNMFVENIGSTQADVIWAAGHTESSWELEYCADTANWISIANPTGGFITLEQLSPNTSYTVRMRSICASDEESAWTNANFRTDCSDITTLPYNENFDSYAGYTTTVASSSNLPECWDHINDGTNTSYSGYPIIYNDSTYASSGTNALRFFNYVTIGSYDSQYAILPAVDTSIYPMNSLQLSFDARLISTYYPFTLIVGIISDATDRNTFEPIDTITITSNTYTNFEFPFNMYTGNGNRIALMAPLPINLGTNYNQGYVDNVVIEPIPDCPKPNHITTDATTPTSITLSWNEPGSATNWNIEYGPIGFTQGTGTMLTNVNNPTTVSDLTANTFYDFYIQADCGNGDYSNWSIVYTEHTDCGAISQLPFTENFDNYGTGEGAYPLCWSKINTYSSDRPYISSSYYQGSGSLYFYANGAGTYNVAITQVFDISIPSNTLYASFMYKASTGNDQLIVGVMSDPTDISTFVAVDTVYPSTPASTWVEKEVFFDQYSGNGQHIAFMNKYSSSYAYAYIDNLIIDQIPSCLKPYSITVSNIESTSADVSWTPHGTESSWNLEYKTSESDTWTSINVNTPSHSLTGLTASTSYEIRVQADCNGGEVSDWRETSFQTLLCESENQCTYTITVTGEYEDSWDYNSISVQQNGIEIAVIYEIGAYTATIPVALCDGIPTSLVFTSSWYDFECGMTIYNPDGSQLFQQNNMSYYNTYTFTANCSGTAIDSCDTPTNVIVSNISQTSAIVSWTAGNEETSWNVEYKTQGTTQWQQTTVQQPSCNITGLSANTTYDVRVQADCGENTSEWTTTYSFTTLNEDFEPCDAPTNLTITDISATSATISWTPGGNESAWNIQYKLASVASDEWGELIHVTNTPSYTITDLAASTAYQVRVQADCGDNNLSYFLNDGFTTEVGIHSIELANHISLQPNPADKYIELNINSNIVMTEAMVYNAFGQLIQTVQLTDNHARIDLSNMAAGMYFVRVNGDNVTATKKFIRK